MSAFVNLSGAPTKDVFRDGVLYRYCASCDAHYTAGWWQKHKETGTHMAAERDKRAMLGWYKENGS